MTDATTATTETASATATAGATTGATPGTTSTAAPATNGTGWYSSIKDEGLRGAVSKFDSQDKLLEAVGYKAPDWRAGVKDDKLKEHAQRFTSAEDAIRANLDMRQKLSSAIVRPGKDAKPEEVAAFRKALGIPDKAEDYKWPDPPQGQALTAEQKAEREMWGKEFHEAGLTAEQANRLVSKFGVLDAEIKKKQIEGDKRFADEQSQALRTKWGPDHDRNQAFAGRAFADLAKRAGLDVEALKQIETKDGRFLLDRADMLEMFAIIGREMGEGSLGPALSAGERETAEGELRGLRDQIKEAQAKGDSKRANDLYQKEQRLIARIGGNRPVVGAQGRTA